MHWMLLYRIEATNIWESGKACINYNSALIDQVNLILKIPVQLLLELIRPPIVQGEKRCQTQETFHHSLIDFEGIIPAWHCLGTCCTISQHFKQPLWETEMADAVHSLICGNTKGCHREYLRQTTRVILSYISGPWKRSSLLCNVDQAERNGSKLWKGIVDSCLVDLVTSCDVLDLMRYPKVDQILRLKW